MAAFRAPQAPMPKVPVPKPVDPNKALMLPPRLKPIDTRAYGKGGTPLGSGPNFRRFGSPLPRMP
jgi:hypothetical protein